MAKRIDILFDHLNNQDLLQPDTVQQMVQISQHVQRKEWDQAQSLFTEIQQAKLESEGTHWMVSDTFTSTFISMRERQTADTLLLGGRETSHRDW